MSRPSVSRVFVVSAALVAVMLVAAASASAAGKPKLENASSAAPALSQLTMKTSVNPNGAATSFYYEYKISGSSETPHKAPEGSLGSGTTGVSASTAVSGLTPYTAYAFRIVASNSYGITTGAWAYEETWSILSAGHEVTAMPLSSAGTATISVPSLALTISCSENGAGAMGGLDGAGDYHNVELTKCSVANLPKCTVTVSPMQLGANFKTKYEEYPLTFVDFDETNCGGLFDMNLAEGTGFINGPLSREPKTQQSFTLTDKTKFGLNAVTITLNTTWELVNHEKFWLGE